MKPFQLGEEAAILVLVVLLSIIILVLQPDTVYTLEFSLPCHTKPARLG